MHINLYLPLHILSLLFPFPVVKTLSGGQYLEHFFSFLQITLTGTFNFTGIRLKISRDSSVGIAMG
jgi:hypothetical protein